MRTCTPLLGALTVLLGIAFLHLAGPAGAQDFAPGPSAPSVNPGGYGPGGFLLAPGPSSADVDVEQVGPGGTKLAPGPAGRLSNSRVTTKPRLPRDAAPLKRRKAAKRVLYR
jgi:hypothetical protein